MLKFIIIINLLFAQNYLFLNDEFAIMVSLLLVFLFLLLTLKKYIINMFFYIFDNIYYYFFVLLNINMYVYNLILKKIIYIICLINYNQKNIIYIYSNIIFIKKCKELIVKKYINKISLIYTKFILIFKILKNFKQIILNLKEVKTYNLYKNLYNFIFIYFLKNKKHINYIC
jgi:hypothetical protein